MINPLAFVLVMIGVFLNAFASFYMKKGAVVMNRKKNLISKFMDTYVILGIFLFVLSAVFYIGSMRFENLSVISPMTGIAFIIVAFLSKMLLKEKIGAQKIAGIALIIIGTILVASF
ncbi:EamA family transporter [Candidatus Woesearchaeota archaeon]|nr:EamA family transporter [Candidatus Woesearchaeota archaeon]